MHEPWSTTKSHIEYSNKTSNKNERQKLKREKSIVLIVQNPYSNFALKSAGFFCFFFVFFPSSVHHSELMIPVKMKTRELINNKQRKTTVLARTWISNYRFNHKVWRDNNNNNNTYTHSFMFIISVSRYGICINVRLMHKKHFNFYENNKSRSDKNTT